MMKNNYLLFILAAFLLLSGHDLTAQQKTITGTVLDEEGLPLPGVNVFIKGTTVGTQTNFDGNYSIEAGVGQTLVFSFIGFGSQEVIVKAENEIDVVMNVAADDLDEVIVVGYGTTRRELSTSAISTVSAREIEDFVPSTSVDNILQGQAAGVQVTAVNGRPGNTAFVQIRGVGSLGSSTTPLYIVDGIPIDAADVANINPNDIASLSILKDAATVSKYGSRGANGVVLISTKRGAAGEARITFRSAVGFGEKTADPFDLMNVDQKLRIEREFAELGVNAASSLPGATASPERIVLLQSYETDWLDEILRKSYIQSENLSISGGSEDISYYFSVGYDKNSGIIDRIDGFERISTRLNTAYQAKDWLEIGNQISLSRSTTDLPRDRYNVQNPFVAMYTYNPYEPLYSRDAEGNVILDAEGNPVYNLTTTGFPIARALLTEPEDIRNFLIIGGVYADIKFSENFSNKFSVGATSNRYNRTSRSLPGGVLDGYVGNANFPGTQIEEFSLDFEYNVNNVFSYRDSYYELHNFQADFLLEYNEDIYTDLFADARGFPSPDIPYLDVAAEATDAGSEEIRSRLYSQGLFVDYNYDKKYILSASVRRDGSSRFGPNNKYGYFYSGSAAWNIANEAFMEDSAFGDLKLRASYGTSGNQEIDDFEFLNLLEFNTYNGRTTAIPVGIGNPEIQWESQAILDVGLEFSLYRNRISGVVDYFQKSSQDLLLDRPISQTAGDEDNSIVSNVGEVKNEGVEITLRADIIRKSDLIWTVGGNASFLDNEVVSLVDGADINNGTTILREGEEIYSFYLVRYAGVNPANGQPLYLDADGNLTAEYSSSDAVLLEGKSPYADLEGGFFTSLTYKGFGLRGDFIFKRGNYILNYQYRDLTSISGITGVLATDAFNYWKNPGDQNVLPSPRFQGTADQESSRLLERGDYLRLRTLTFDYRIPSGWIEPTFDAVRFYVTGQNLLTFTKYNGDPEIGLGSEETLAPDEDGFVPGEYSLYSYPQIRSFTFGIDLTF